MASAEDYSDILSASYNIKNSIVNGMQMLDRESKSEFNLQQSLSNLEMARENSQKKQQILVIDDTSTNLKLISDFLRESEFEVRVAKSGAQAMKLLEPQSQISLCWMW
ncbi:MAG: response regulator [Microcoleus sp. SU_5_6]|nr:response regulator [Microcoleus sp. SU_5_6]